jgi:hypothetical protein
MSDIKYACRKVRNTLLLGTITDTLTICEKNTQNPKEKSTQDLEQLHPYLIVERQN